MPPTGDEPIEGQVLGAWVARHTVNLANVSDPPALARSAVHEALANRADEEQVRDVALVADELVSNSIRHAGGALLLSLDFYDWGVTVGVVDGGADITLIPLDVINHPVSELINLFGVDSLPEDGRGLLLVDQLATVWGVERAAMGKIVFAAFLRKSD